MGPAAGGGRAAAAEPPACHETPFHEQLTTSPLLLSLSLSSFPDSEAYEPADSAAADSFQEEANAEVEVEEATPTASLAHSQPADVFGAEQDALADAALAEAGIVI